MRLSLERKGITLFSLAVFERPEVEPEEAPPPWVSVGFCSTERSGPYLEDRQGLSEGTERL